MKQPTLIVLAAGMGSRYGGLKQLDGVGPSGETLSSIARKYGVSVSELKRSNGLSSDRLSVGQKLTVKKK